MTYETLLYEADGGIATITSTGRTASPRSCPRCRTSSRRPYTVRSQPLR